MALINRYSTIARGAITFTGNTLGLSKDTNLNLPGTEDSIGALISLTQPALAGWPSPPGTTLNYTQDSSAAILNIPAGSTILYAELIWAGSYITTQGSGQNLSAFINNSITFTTPAGTYTIAPDAATAQQFSPAVMSSYYTRSAIVTSLVQASMGGTYSAGSIVGTTSAANNTDNAAGWTLAVVYSNPVLTARKLNLYVGGVFVDGVSGPVDTTVSGFITPSSGTVNARVLFNTVEGDATRVGDQALIGPTTATLTTLSGPNNPVNNFFASQINNDSGNLDTTGSFGTRNQNAAAGTNISAGRQGWDITNVSGNAGMTNNQTTAAVRLTTSGDRYLTNALGIQIDSQAANLVLVKSVDKAFAQVGDELLYTVVITNNGEISANNIIFTDIVPAGTTYVPSSFALNSVVIPGADPNSGVNIGSISAGGTATVTFKVTVNNQSTPVILKNQSTTNYDFQPLPGYPSVSASSTSNQVSTQIERVGLDIVKNASRTVAIVGDTIVYSFVISNTGTVPVTNVMFNDVPPSGTSFISNTFTVNGVVISGANPSAGVNIGTIAAGSSVNVSFSVSVNSVPVPNTLINSADLDFNYQLGPTSPIESSSTGSNTTITDVEIAQLSVNKSIDKIVAEIGEYATYTVVVTNTGTIAANNVIFTDNPPLGTSFVTGSVIVNGVSNPSANPSAGINLGTIAPGASVTVNFQVHVDFIPAPNPTNNIASVSGSFLVDPNFPPITRSFNSEIVPLTIVIAQLQAVKSVDKSVAEVGDILNYTVVITNTGTVQANNVIFTDTPPNGTSFIANSVTVNGSSVPSANPSVGFNIGSIAAGASVTVIFRVTVDSIPIPNPIVNNATIDAQFIIDPNSPPVDRTYTSQPVDTLVKLAELTTSKSVDKAYATVGDMLTYTITITNTGTVIANNVVFTDVPPNGTSFVNNSVTINGSPVSGNPSLGILIGSIPVGATVTITFKVSVNAIPVPNPTNNIAIIDASFIIDPLQQPVSKSFDTNPAQTLVERASLTAVKSENKQYAKVGDTLTYTVVVTNTGTVTANNVVFYDTPPSGTNFVTGSFKIGGVTQPGASPLVGVNLGSLAPGASVTVSFDVIVNSLPSPAQIANSATINYQYKIDPNGSTISGTTTSNIVTAQIEQPQLTLTKLANKAFVEMGDTLTYTVIITNTGTVTTNNVIFKDIPPAGTTFIPGTFRIGVTPQPGADPSVGVNVGSIAPGASITVSFDVTVDSLPPSGQITNTASAEYEFKISPQGPTETRTDQSNPITTDVEVASLSLVKTQSKNFVEVGETLTYTVVVTNTGTVIANNVIFKDTPPVGTSYVTGTFKKNGIIQPGANPSVGVNLGSIAPGAFVTVTFDVNIDSLPPSGQIINSASADYEFKIDPNGPTETRTELSNTVIADVEIGNLDMVKSVDKSFVEVGDTATYSVLITNTGTVSADNVIFKDTPPAGTSFIPGTFKINGVPQLGANPAIGVNLGSIPAGESVTVSFDVSIDSLPPSGQIINTASVAFEYKVNPNEPSKPGTSQSNPVTSEVELVELEVVKTADKAFVKVGDTITYMFNITNTGTVTANNVTFNDTPPAGTTFIPNSFKIEGVPQPGADPTIGINLGTLVPGASVNVSFDVTIDVLPPPPSVIINTASVIFEYKVDPTGPVLTETTPSNPHTAKVEEVKVSMVKSVNKAFAEVGETLTYSVVIANSGTIAGNNVIFKDIDPQGASFIAGSFKINGSPQGGADPNVGVNIGTIPAGGSVTVSYNVTVNSVPPSGQIKNTALATFEYKVDPMGPTETEDINSNEVITEAELGQLKVEKTVDKAYVEVGDTLTYTVNITNTGTVTASNVKFKDIAPVGTSFISGSFKINGVPEVVADPSLGVNLGSLAPGDNVTVSFDVTVNSIPPGGLVINAAEVTFEYKVDPNGPIKIATVPSNEVESKAEIAELELTKSSNKEYVEVGSTLTYTTVIKNTGTVMASNVVFKDIPPTNTTFASNSLKVNGVTQIGANPSVGVNVGNIAPGNSVIVSYNVTVDTLPIPPELINTAFATFDFTIDPNGPTSTRTTESNEVISNVVLVKLDVLKEADKTAATVGDIINYSISVINTGTVTAQNVIIKDVVPAGTTFALGSLAVNGMSKPEANPNAGVELGNIAPGGFVIITFSVKVESIPDPPVAKNMAVADFKVQIDPNGPIEDRTSESNEVITELKVVELKAVKKVDKNTAEIGDELTYTIVITNTGTVTAAQVRFTDNIPEGTEFVVNSLTINGVQQPGVRPWDDVLLGTIEPGESVTVTFKVKVTFISCPPKLVNTATIKFKYQLEVGGATISVITESNEAVTYVGIKIFKQISIDENLTIPEVKPDAEEILEVIADVVITYTNVIKTPIVTSYEGQQLTGWKLIVEGYLRQKVVYIADEPTQAVHAAEFNIPFSTFLVLSKDYKECQSIRVEGVIEDIFFKLVDKRTIFKNVTLMLEGKESC